MNYTFFAIGCYIIMRGLQVLFEEKKEKKWARLLIKGWTVFTLYAGLASLAVWYIEVPFLIFQAGK
ncbi:MAG: hypothetical protein PHF84_09125 [bacterium]|nr:hypothetical protein [bacterium]